MQNPDSKTPGPVALPGTGITSSDLSSPELDQGLISRKLNIDELFVETTLET